jgi:uncharacterized C2H2 Zn-finger protein
MILQMKIRTKNGETFNGFLRCLMMTRRRKLNSHGEKNNERRKEGGLPKAKASQTMMRRVNILLQMSRQFEIQNTLPITLSLKVFSRQGGGRSKKFRREDPMVGQQAIAITAQQKSHTMVSVPQIVECHPPLPARLPLPK